VLIPLAPEYAKNTHNPIIKNVKNAKNMNISNILIVIVLDYNILEPLATFIKVLGSSVLIVEP